MDQRLGSGASASSPLIVFRLFKMALVTIAWAIDPRRITLIRVEWSELGWNGRTGVEWSGAEVEWSELD